MSPRVAALLLAVAPSAVVGGTCDIYKSGGTPCVAAHAMTRALYDAYNGPLYRVKRHSDGAARDIPLTKAGGVADTAVQDAFCKGVVCEVVRIYDQSPMENHLGIEHGAPNLLPPRNVQDYGVNFTDPRSKAALGSNPVYAAFFAGDPDFGHPPPPFKGQGYSNRTARGTAKGDEPESMYAVFSGAEVFQGGCCFDYGNAEDRNASGQAGPMFNGAMEAIYFQFGKIGADLEHGIYGQQKINNTDFVVGFVKGNSGNHYSVRAGDAQKPGSMQTAYDGPRPNGYEVMKKQGGIVLGIGGDNSPWAAGVFYEGVMTTGYASAKTEEDVLADINKAGYKRV